MKVQVGKNYSNYREVIQVGLDEIPNDKTGIPSKKVLENGAMSTIVKEPDGTILEIQYIIKDWVTVGVRTRRFNNEEDRLAFHRL